MKGNSYLQIDLQALRENVLQIQQELKPGVKLIPVLKGNAYGLGAVRLARVLSTMDGIDIFAVSHMAEGIELRKAGFRGFLIGECFMKEPDPAQALATFVKRVETSPRTS